MNFKANYKLKIVISKRQSCFQRLYFQRNTGAEGEVTRETQCVAIARVGAKDQKMASGTLEELAKVDLGEPLHCFVVTGKLHPMEEEFLAQLVQRS